MYIQSLFSSRPLSPMHSLTSRCSHRHRLQTLRVIRVGHLARPRRATSRTSPTSPTTLPIQSRARRASRRRRSRRSRGGGRRCTTQLTLDKSKGLLAILGSIPLVRRQRVAIAAVLVCGVAVGLDLGCGGADEA